MGSSAPPSACCARGFRAAAPAPSSASPAPGRTTGPSEASSPPAGTRAEESRVRRTVDLFLPVSTIVERFCRLFDGNSQVQPNFIRALPPAPTSDARLEQLPDRPFILYFGDVTEDKGVWNLAEAYTELEEPPPLVLIGRNYLDELADRPGVYALGPWPHDLVIEALRRSLFTVAPSIWPEPFGLVALEAAAAGKAVIASNIGGLLDIVVDGETGILVEPGDRDALRASMRALIDDGELRDRLGAAGIARAAVVRPRKAGPPGRGRIRAGARPAQVKGPGEGAVGTPVPRLSIRSQLLAGTALLFALRVVISAIRTGPVLVADEIGYLTNARVIAGGLAGQLEMAPFYRGGYSLLIAPLINVSSDPKVVYALVLVLNAALAASIFPLLYLLLRRFSSIQPRRAIWAALAGAVYPAVTVLSQVAMSENVLFPLVCLWLIAFAGLLEARQGRAALLWASGVGASAGALWAVHNRMIVALAISLAGLLWLAARRRIPVPAAAAGIALIAAAVVGTHLLDAHLIDNSYGGVASSEVHTRTSDLLTVSGLRTAAANLVGQTWYLLVATFGLATLVVADFLRRRRGLEGVLLAFTAGLLLVSAAAFPERTRPDMLIYGRYVEVAAPALIALGLAALAAGRLPRWTKGPAIGFAALTAAVVLIRATASDPDAANRWNISSLPFVTMQLGPGILVGAAIIACGGAIMLAYGARHRPALLGPLAVALFLAVAAYGVWNPVRSSERAVYPSGWTSPQDVAERESIERVYYDLDNYDTIGLYVPQWFLPDTSIDLFHGDHRPPSGRYVLSGASWAREHRGAWRAVWRAAGRDEVLWMLR